jgi:hypothetical protein
MPDISMCPGGECPLKENCLRYKSKPGMLQTYFLTPPFVKDSCDYFYPVKKKEKNV